MSLLRTCGKLTFKVYELVWRLRAARRTVILPPPPQADDHLPPIFLIGCPRSGTTLLRVILDSHSQLACPPETFYLLELAELWKSEDAMRGLEEMGFDRPHVRTKLRQFAGYFLHGYCHSRRKNRVVEKTPHYVACLDFIEEIFGPDCQYIMLYRHPYDVVLSMFNHLTLDWHPLIRKYVEREPNKHLAYARFWEEHTSRMLRFEAEHPTRCRRVLYEQLATDAEPVLRQLFEFLQAGWEPMVLKYYEQQHDLGRGDRKALIQKGIKGSIDNWHSLDDELLDQMRTIVQRPAMALGYHRLQRDHTVNNPLDEQCIPTAANDRVAITP